MIKFIISIFSLLLITPLYADIYKWTDSQGVVHFSDEPHQGAEKITLPPTQMTTQPTPNANTTPTSINNKSSATSNEYKAVIISQPSNDSTIRNNQGYVSVAVNVEPDIQTGDTLQLIFDNQPLGKPQAGKSFILNNVNRGTHTVAVQILNTEGEVLMTSDGVTFHMHRPRVGMVPNTRPANTP